MRLWRHTVLWYLGGLVYALLELLWRGRTHWSMFITGGICFLLIGYLGRIPQPIPVVFRVVLGSAIITMAELAAGLLVNRSYTVWDYRAMPLNFLGQICLPFSLLWLPVSLGAILLYDGLNHILFHRAFSRHRWL